MTPIKTWTQELVTLDFHQEIYEKLQSQYANLSEFLEVLKYFIEDLSNNSNLYNINPYNDSINKGIYILGKTDTELGIFPNPKLALKCSKGQPWSENLRNQFHKTIQLAQDWETKLNPEEKKLLHICPVYLHFESRQTDSAFKQVLFMQRIDGGISLGNTESGFSDEFCRVFNIPRLEEIQNKPQFALHRRFDKDKHRQLLKIQTVYLFQRLWRKGIKILSLNQKNILIDTALETGQTKYTIIDTTEDFFPPISPLYNILTNQLCT